MSLTIDDAHINDMCINNACIKYIDDAHINDNG